MEIVVVGVNHKAAPVAVREMLAFTPVQMEAALQALQEQTSESVLLSTCNRTEIYAAVPTAEDGVQRIVRFLTGFHRCPAERFTPFLFSLSGKEAVDHLFSVASGLDSMILGEPQILGQVRQAYVAAAARGTVGARLSRVFLQALKVGKQVRTETNISRSAVSISHAAVELAKSVFDGDLSGRSVLLIGAGAMAELAAKNLMDNGCTALVVTNRTHGRACELAATYGGTAVEFTELGRLLSETDIALTCTGAPDFILGREMVQASVGGRRGRPLFLIDIAVPRDVDPEVSKLEGVVLHDIDDLKSVCSANLEERQGEVAAARRIIDAEVECFEEWWNSLQVVPTIRALRDRAEQIQQAELRKALSRLGNLSDRQRSTVEALASGIVNKILHQPTVRLKSYCDSEAGAAYALTLRELFGLEDEMEAAKAYTQERTD